MVLYKSHCREVKTFYGETFHYGETKAVKGYIHDPRFICLGIVKPSSDSAVVEEPKLETKKVEAKKVETKKLEPKKLETKKSGEKKAEAKKAEVKSATKSADKKSETKKPEEQKSETKIESKDKKNTSDKKD